MRKFGFILALAIASVCSCTKIIEKDVIVEVPQDALGYFYFDGEEHPVNTLSVDENSDYVRFLIASEPKEPYFSYIDLCVLKSHLGKTIDISDNVHFTKNYDYLIGYEDMEHFYPTYTTPKGGTIKVRLSNSVYKINLDVRLADGKSLKFNY